MDGKQKPEQKDSGATVARNGRNKQNGNEPDRGRDNDDEIRRAMHARKGSPFLSTKEAAFYLGIKPRTLIRWRQQGKGPPCRKHERIRVYHIDEVDHWSMSGRP